MDPDRRVQQLVIHYGGIEVLHPIISELMKSQAHNDIFQRSVEQELRALQSRSPHLADHEISIVQKAFITLMSSDEHQAGAAELYVEEIIGLKLVAPEERSGALQTTLNARNLILKNSAHGEQLASRWYDRDRSQTKEEGLFLSSGSIVENSLASVSQGASQADKSDAKNEIREAVTLPAHQIHFDSDPNFIRSWNQFEAARKDFRSRGIDNHDRIESAKFLRDSAQNVADYIQLRQPSAMTTNDASSEDSQGLARKLSELKSSYNQAVEVVKTGYGGRDRRFEYRKTDVPWKTRDSQYKSISQENVRQPEVINRSVYSSRERSSHARYRRRPIRPRGTDQYRPTYS